MSSIRVIGPRFTMVPEFVLELRIDAQAFRLYAVLLSYSDHEGESFPSLAKIRERMDMVSEETIRRARRVLVEAGLLDVEERMRDNGSRTSNLYTVYTDHPRTGERGVPPTGERISLQRVRGPEGESKELESKRTPPKRPPTPAKVDGKVIGAREAEIAHAVLDHWNVVTRSNPPFRSFDWVKKIVMRVREHPDLGAADFCAVVDRAMRNPWWDGPASPAVVFGNGTIFEQTMVSNGATKRKRRYGIGVTPGELGDLIEQMEARNERHRGGSDHADLDGGLPPRELGPGDDPDLG